MTTCIRIASFTAAVLLSPLLAAQAPVASSKPLKSTGQCKDGTYTTAPEKSGACRGHKGLREWYASSSAPQPSVASTAIPPTAVPQPADSNQLPAAPRKGPKANLATTPAAPGGAPNLVWLNASSNVYHCYGTDFYGKTKSGSYLPEAEAKAKGAHGNRGATCTK